MASIKSRLKRLEGQAGNSTGDRPRFVLSLTGGEANGPSEIMFIQIAGTYGSAMLTRTGHPTQDCLLDAADEKHREIHGEGWPAAELAALRRIQTDKAAL